MVMEAKKMVVIGEAQSGGPEAVPEIGFGDLIKYYQRYGPAIQEFVSLIRTIEGGGPATGTLPELKTDLGARRLRIGPIPYALENR
jgi:hypothetical protein